MNLQVGFGASVVMGINRLFVTQICCSFLTPQMTFLVLCSPWYLYSWPISYSSHCLDKVPETKQIRVVVHRHGGEDVEMGEAQLK